MMPILESKLTLFSIVEDKTIYKAGRWLIGCCELGFPFSLISYNTFHLRTIYSIRCYKKFKLDSHVGIVKKKLS